MTIKEQIPGTENMAIEVAFNSLKIANVREARKLDKDSTRIDITVTFSYLNRKQRDLVSNVVVGDILVFGIPRSRACFEQFLLKYLKQKQRCHA